MQIKPTIRKVLASTVPYGDSICTRGKHVWAAYDGDRLVCVGATSREARMLYRRACMNGGYGRPPTPLPSELEGRRDKPQRLSDEDTKG
jgi:hypothetical protein